MFFFVVFVWLSLCESRWDSLRMTPFVLVAYLTPLLLRDASASDLASISYSVPLYLTVGEVLAWRTARLRELAGDEFVVLIRTDDATRVARRIANRLIVVLGGIRSDDGQAIHASVGVASGTALDSRKIIKAADEAMYAAKRAHERNAGLWNQCDWAATQHPPSLPSPSGPTAATSCDPNYSGCVPVHPPDVDCNQIDGPVTVLGADPHHLDGNGDGHAC